MSRICERHPKYSGKRGPRTKGDCECYMYWRAQKAAARAGHQYFPEGSSDWHCGACNQPTPPIGKLHECDFLRIEDGAFGMAAMTVRGMESKGLNPFELRRLETAWERAKRWRNATHIDADFPELETSSREVLDSWTWLGDEGLECAKTGRSLTVVNSRRR